MRLVVGDSLAVVDAAVRSDVDAGARRTFVRDFVAAWSEVMDLDRFELA